MIRRRRSAWRWPAPRCPSPRPRAARSGAASTRDFSRVVLTIEPTTEWSLETVAGRATIRFPGKALAFDPDGVFAKMPATRILAVRTSRRCRRDDRGGRSRLRLPGQHFVRGRALPGARRRRPGRRRRAAPELAAETAARRARARETVAVATAEQLLIRQIERAAGQGLVEMSEASPARRRPTLRRPRPSRRSRRRRRRRPRPNRRRRPRREPPALPRPAGRPDGGGRGDRAA